MNDNCTCKNNYDENTFMESFGKNESEMRKCNNCENMTYEDGIVVCEKFNKRND